MSHILILNPILCLYKAYNQKVHEVIFTKKSLSNNTFFLAKLEKLTFLVISECGEAR